MAAKVTGSQLVNEEEEEDLLTCLKQYS